MHACIASFTFTFTFMHLADAFIQSDLHCIQVTVSTFYQLLLSLGKQELINIKERLSNASCSNSCNQFLSLSACLIKEYAMMENKLLGGFENQNQAN